MKPIAGKCYTARKRMNQHHHLTLKNSETIWE